MGLRDTPSAEVLLPAPRCGVPTHHWPRQCAWPRALPPSLSPSRAARGARAGTALSPPETGVTPAEKKSRQKHRALGRSSARDARRRNRTDKWTSLDTWGCNSLARASLVTGQPQTPEHSRTFLCYPKVAKKHPSAPHPPLAPQAGLTGATRNAPLPPGFTVKWTGRPRPRRRPHFASCCGRQSHVNGPQKQLPPKADGL